MSFVSRIRDAGATTPGLYRIASVAVAATLVVTAVLATLAASEAESSSSRLEANTAPVLVATQSLLASLAEADAAATAAFLSGAEEDREQRRLYEEALARVSAQSEEISALIGDAEAAHGALKALGVRVNRYAGLVEAARATQRAGAPGGEDYLLRALDEIAAAVGDDAAALTELSEERFDRDTDRASPTLVLAVVAAALALATIVTVSVVVARRSRRVFNPLLALAGLLALLAGGWLLVTSIQSARDIDEARGNGYDAIALTAQIQSAAFGAKTAESIAMISGDATARSRADEAAARLTSGAITQAVADAARNATATGDGLLFTAAAEADSPRERAAVAEMMVRWQRYDDTVDRLRGASGDAARAIAVGPASATFNGFNFSVESVLADNRDQFLAAVADADARMTWLSTITLVFPLLAATAALAGLQIRINEYR